MKPIPSILTWRVPWTEEPGRRQSMGSQSLTRLKATVHTRLQELFKIILTKFSTNNSPLAQNYFCFKFEFFFAFINSSNSFQRG